MKRSCHPNLTDGKITKSNPFHFKTTRKRLNFNYFKELLIRFNGTAMDDAINIMKSIGKNEEMCIGYAEWPLFNNIRKTKQFKNTYKDIFGREYQYKESQQTRWEDIIQEAVDMIKESKEHKSKEKKSELKGNV